MADLCSCSKIWTFLVLISFYNMKIRIAIFTWCLWAVKTSALNVPFLKPKISTSQPDTTSAENVNTAGSTRTPVSNLFSNEVQELAVNPVNGGIKVSDGLSDRVQQFADPAKLVKVGGIAVNKVQHAIGNVTGHIGTEVEKAIDCYENLGCFPNTSPWYSLLRPFPAPMTPHDIDTKIYLYTSSTPESRYAVTLWNEISIDGSDFDPSRPYTAFITHGFASNGNVTWVLDLKDAYLRKRNANVFIVDWGKGASTWNYLQVASNTRIVGAELARFGKYLIEQKNLNPKRIHLMGHSLGAHISSYMAKNIPKIAQLTAFDPAQPGFEGFPNEVRLHKSDADFVDVIHTNARPCIPLLGFGLILPAGHADYYMNGGLIQPGCVLPPVDAVQLDSIADLGKYPVEVISSWVSCSHGKSYLYYTEALLNDYCTFWGKLVGALGTAIDIGTLGISEKLVGKFTGCTLEKCLPIGLESQEYPARGVFAASTHLGSPYCFDDPKITTSMKEQRAVQLQKQQQG